MNKFLCDNIVFTICIKVFDISLLEILYSLKL
jgi:hypothetical protein